MIQTAEVIQFSTKKKAIVAKVTAPVATPTNKKAVKAAAEQAKKAITTPDNPLNMFAGSSLFDKLVETERVALRVHEEMKTIMKAGSGGKSRNPLEAASLAPLRMVSRRGCPLMEVLMHHLESPGRGGYRTLNSFGIEMLGCREGELTIGLDLRYHSKAEALFTRAGVPNWRTLVAQDCERLIIEHMFGPYYTNAWAVFRIGGKNYRKRDPDEISPLDDESTMEGN